MGTPTEILRIIHQIHSTIETVDQFSTAVERAKDGEQPTLIHNAQVDRALHNLSTLSAHLKQLRKDGLDRPTFYHADFGDLMNPDTRLAEMIRMTNTHTELATAIEEQSSLAQGLLDLSNNAETRANALEPLIQFFPKVIDSPVPFAGTWPRADALGHYELLQAAQSALNSVAADALTTHYAVQAEVAAMQQEFAGADEEVRAWITFFYNNPEASDDHDGVDDIAPWVDYPTSDLPDWTASPSTDDDSLQFDPLQTSHWGDMSQPDMADTDLPVDAPYIYYPDPTGGGSTGGSHADGYYYPYSDGQSIDHATDHTFDYINSGHYTERGPTIDTDGDGFPDQSQAADYYYPNSDGQSIDYVGDHANAAYHDGGSSQSSDAGGYHDLGGGYDSGYDSGGAHDSGHDSFHHG